MTSESYDYVGHITYPYCKEVVETFYNHANIKRYLVSRNNNPLVATTKFNNEFSEFLKKVGYTVRIEKIRDYAPKKTIECIPIRVQKIGNKGKPEEVLVLVKARDFRELNENVDKLKTLVKARTGIDGRLDLFGKTEMC